MTAASYELALNGRYSNIKHSASSLVENSPRFKVGYITCGATVDDGETFSVNLYENFKITKLLGIIGFIHTTANSVIVVEAPTTTVDRETLTITVGGSTDNKQRFYVVYGI